MATLNSVSYGQTSGDVTTLQNFLISKGFTIPAGATGYFGDQTKTALSQWQNSVGITSSTPGYGTNFGSQSIAKASASTSPIQNQSNAYTGQITQSAAPPVQNQVNTSGVKKPLDPAILSQITSNLGPNMQNDPAQVKVLQQALVNAGYMNQADIDAQGTAYNYGPLTTAAVAAWQKENNVSTNGADGYFGPVSKYTVQNGKPPEDKSPISPIDNKNDNASVNDGDTSGVTTPDLTDTTVGNLSQNAFGALAPLLKKGTPEYQAAMDKISTLYFDTMEQQMNATTEQEQQAAQYNWDTLKKYIETNLNITLSNDSMQAWDQIQGLQSQYGGQNLSGSGIEAESMDDYLKKIRLTDSAARNESQTKEDAAQQDYYMKFATPEQIAALDPQKARDWGLIPSDGKTMAQRVAEMKAKYPNLSDAEIQSNLASIYDAKGNYRSDLYQRKMTGNNSNIDVGNVDTGNIVKDEFGNSIVVPYRPSDTGILDIEQAKQQMLAANTPLAQQKLDAEKRLAYGSTPTTPIDESGNSTSNRFMQKGPYTDPIIPTVEQKAATDKAATAAANLGTGTVTPPPTTPPPTPTPTPTPTIYAGGKQPDDPTNKYNTATGQLNPKYVSSTSSTPTTNTSTTNPLFMTSAEMMGGATGLAAYQKRIASLPK